MKGTFKTVWVIFLVWAMVFPTAWAEGLDLYVVYTGKQKKEKDQLLNAFPKDLSVKTYNVDLLVLADYSGKQKAVARLEKARMILILQDSPMEGLKGIQVRRALLVVKSVKKTVKSGEWMLHVVAKGTDLADLGDKVKILEATVEGDLEDAKTIRSSEVVLVNEKSLDLFKAVSLIVDKVLSL